MNSASFWIKIIFLLYLFTQFAISGDSQKRAFWVVRYALLERSELDRIVHTAYQAGITDLFIQIRALGQTYYPSNIEAAAPAAADSFDRLHYLIDKCKIYDIRVHAWVNMFYIWSGNALPENPQHVFTTFKQHILSNSHFPDYSELRAAGIEGFFLDPGNIKVQKYLLNLLCEIADIYDVAGLHLDYFRYPDIRYSFTPDNRTEFMMQNHYDPMGVYLQQSTYVNERGYQVFVSADKLYRRFLISELTQYLERIHNRLQKNYGDIELSIAVKPDPVIAKHRYFQDWKNWLEKGICSFVALMNYRTDLKEFTAILDQISEPNLKQRIMVGISTYNQDYKAVNSRINFVKLHHFAGFSLFSYNHLLKNQHYLKQLNLYN
jgi:uncharacterized lipoprotein YddW (UPF0748 family)